MLPRVLSASIFVLIIAPAHAFQIDMESVFPNVAQGHRGNNNNICHEAGKTNSNYRPQLQMNNHAKISGTKNEKLKFCSSNQGSGLPANSCDDGLGGRKTCEVTGDDIRGVHNNGYNAFLSSTKSSQEKGYCSSGEKLLYKGDANKNLGTFSLYSACTLELNADRGDYRVKSLVMGTGAKLILHSGDYWFESLSLNQNSQVEVVGDVRVFIKNNAQFNSAKLGSLDAPAQLVFSYGNFHLTGSSEVNALVYSDEKVIMDNSAVINGRVTAKKLEMNINAVINDSSQVGGGNTPEPEPAQCFEDDFSSSRLNSGWVVSRSRGDFTPAINNNRFRLTQAKTNQATAISYNRIFPSKNNKFVIEFDHYAYGGSGADGIALVLSDASVTAKPGAYGGPLGYGYKPDADGFAGGWLGIGIDEYGNFVREGGGNSRDQQNNTVAIRGAGSGKQGYNLLINTGRLNPEVDSNSNDRPHRYRITVDFTKNDGKARVTVERRAYATSGFDTLIDAFKVEQDNIPEKLLFSITGSTGSSTNIHEIDDVSFCAEQSEELDAQIDHFRFNLTSNEVQACQAQSLTLTACANSDCSQVYNKPVTATLATQAGMTWAGGTSVTFTDSTPLQLTSTIKKVSLDVAGSTPAAVQFSKTLCKVGNSGYSQANCELSFSDELKTFELSFPNGNAVYAGEPLHAVLKPQQNCQPMFANEERNITFAAAAVQPEQPVAKPEIHLEYGNKNTKLDIDGQQTLKVRFDENGEAAFIIHYPEAGKTQLDVKEGSIQGGGQFVTVPRALCVATNPESKDTAMPFKAAGDNFEMSITAHGSHGNADFCQGPVLQNYVHPVAITSELVKPDEGEQGELAVTEYRHGIAQEGINIVKQGTNTLTQQRMSEVGVFNLMASPVGAYHGTSLPVESVPASVGRFYPARFAMDEAYVIATHNGGGNKSYMNQPIELGFTLHALNTEGRVTKNYHGEFVRAQTVLAATSESGENLLSRLNAIAMPGWQHGELMFEQSDLVFNRNASPDGPFAVGFDLNVTDGEEPALTRFFDEVGNPPGCDDGCNKLHLGEHAFHYGRLVASSAQGGINDSLTVPIKAESWSSDNKTWQSFEDGWTELVMALFSFDEHDYAHPNLSLNLDLDKDVVIQAGLGSDKAYAMTLNKGRSSLDLSAPGTAVRVNYQIDLSDYAWLKFDWDGDGNDDESAAGQFIFGQGSGNNSVIYRRETLY